MRQDDLAIFDDDGRLSADVQCLNCGYDLRGQRLDGRCPECGLPVKVSLRRDRLVDADAGYRARLLYGAQLLEIGIWLTLPLLYGGALIAALGWWWLTEPQPGRQEPQLDRRLRQFARWFVWAGFGALVGIAVATLWIGIWRVWRTLGGWQPLDVMLVVLHGLVFMGMLAGFEVLRALARRMPDERLARQCARLGVVSVIALSLACAIALGTSLATNWWYYRRVGPSGMAMELAVFATPLVLWAAAMVWYWLEWVFFSRRLVRAMRRVAGKPATDAVVAD